MISHGYSPVRSCSAAFGMISSRANWGDKFQILLILTTTLGHRGIFKAKHYVLLLVKMKLWKCAFQVEKSSLPSLLGEIDDLPRLVIELKVEAGLVSNTILGRRRGLGGEGSPRDCGLAQVCCDFGEHFEMSGLLI